MELIQVIFQGWKVVDIQSDGTLVLIPPQEEIGSIYGSKQIKVVPACIRLPDPATPEGKEAVNQMRMWLEQDALERVALPPHCQTLTEKIGILYTKTGLEINLELVKQGLAYVYRRYFYNCPEQSLYEEVEKKARQLRVGVWK